MEGTRMYHLAANLATMVKHTLFYVRLEDSIVYHHTIVTTIQPTKTQLALPNGVVHEYRHDRHRDIMAGIESIDGPWFPHDPFYSDRPWTLCLSALDRWLHRCPQQHETRCASGKRMNRVRLVRRSPG